MLAVIKSGFKKVGEHLVSQFGAASKYSSVMDCDGFCTPF